MPLMKTELLSLVVDNEFGVLTRITAAVRREGWNIKSLSVAETANPEISALSLCVEYYEATLDRLISRLGRMDCIRSVAVFDPEKYVAREFVLIALKEEPENKKELLKGYDTLVLHQQSGPIIGCAGTAEQIDELIGALGGNVIGTMRTGSIFVGAEGEKK